MKRFPATKSLPSHAFPSSALILVPSPGRQPSPRHAWSGYAGGFLTLSPQSFHGRSLGRGHKEIGLFAGGERANSTDFSKGCGSSPGRIWSRTRRSLWRGVSSRSRSQNANRTSCAAKKLREYPPASCPERCPVLGRIMACSRIVTRHGPNVPVVL